MYLQSSVSCIKIDLSKRKISGVCTYIRYGELVDEEGGEG